MKRLFVLVYCFIITNAILANNGKTLSGRWKIVDEIENGNGVWHRHKYFGSIIEFKTDRTFVMSIDTVSYLGAYTISGSDPPMIELYFEELHNDSIALIRDDLFFVNKKSASEMVFKDVSRQSNFIRLRREK